MTSSYSGQGQLSGTGLRLPQSLVNIKQNKEGQDSGN